MTPTTTVHSSRLDDCQKSTHAPRALARMIGEGFDAACSEELQFCRSENSQEDAIEQFRCWLDGLAAVVVAALGLDDGKVNKGMKTQQERRVWIC